MTEEVAVKAFKPIKSLDAFHRRVREAMKLRRKLDEIDAWEQEEKSRIAAEANEKRKPLLPRYEGRMDVVMGYIRDKHPTVLKGGDVDEFETEELIVRFFKDGNGTLSVPDVAKLIKYLEARRETKKFVKVEKKLQNAAAFKSWWRANPLRRPPAEIVYKHSINIITKLSAAEKARGKKPQVLKREIA